MKLENNYYVDGNGNKWNAEIYSEAEAVQYSMTLINCVDCEDCKNCVDCRGSGI